MSSYAWQGFTSTLNMTRFAKLVAIIRRLLSVLEALVVDSSRDKIP